MDRFLQRGCREPSPPALHLHTSDQTRGTGSSSESRKHALKRERTSEETDAADSPLLAALCGSGVDAAEQRVVAATRHGAQPGGGAVMMSTAGQALREPGHDVITAPKEERKGKRAMMMRGWKRDAVIRTRKEKYTDVFAPSALPELLSRDGHCAAEWMGAENDNGQENGMIGMNGLNGLNGLKSGSAAVVSPAVKKHRGADKVGRWRRTESWLPTTAGVWPSTQSKQRGNERGMERGKERGNEREKEREERGKTEGEREGESDGGNMRHQGAVVVRRHLYIQRKRQTDKHTDRQVSTSLGWIIRYD